jgi:uncharacterized phiE125 gp8 family phage protein
MNLVVVTSPAAEPISLANAKLQARVDGTTEDALMTLYITAAREICEGISRRAFATQTLRLTLDAWPDKYIIKLPRPPLQSVTSVIYTDLDGVAHTLNANDYVVDTDSEPGRVAIKNTVWPAGSLREIGGIKITYQAGYGTSNPLPKGYEIAMLLLISHMYENREVLTEASLSEIPYGASALLSIDKGWYFE